MHLIWHVHRFVFRVSWHSSPSSAAVSWHRWQRYSQIRKQCWRDPCPICLLAMMNREDLHLHNLVRFHFNGYAYHILCICLVYQMYIQCISYVNVNDRTGILTVYTPYSISCIENGSFLCFAWLGARHMGIGLRFTYTWNILRIYNIYTMHIAYI